MAWGGLPEHFASERTPGKRKRGQPRRRNVEMGPKKEEITSLSDTMP